MHQLELHLHDDNTYSSIHPEPPRKQITTLSLHDALPISPDAVLLPAPDRTGPGRTDLDPLTTPSTGSSSRGSRQAARGDPAAVTSRVDGIWRCANRPLVGSESISLAEYRDAAR